MKYLNTLKILPLLVAGLLLCSPAFAGDISLTDLVTGDEVSEIVISSAKGTTLQLGVRIPADKILRAYSFNLLEDSDYFTIEKVTPAADAVLPPMLIGTKKADQISVNGMDIDGISAGKDGKVISLVDITMHGVSSGTSELTVVFTVFGNSGDDQFIPDALVIPVTIR